MGTVKYFDRDLSWLSFNYRVLEEARDPSVPLYERIKFLSIYSSNLDEFFRVRVASLRAAIKLEKEKFSINTALSPSKLLEKIIETVKKQQNEFGEIYRNQILPELKNQKIILYSGEEIEEAHRAPIRSYFRSHVLTFLRPVIVSEKSKKPFLENRAIYFLLELQRKGEYDTPTQYAVLNIPSGHLPRFHALPPLHGFYYYIFLDDIIRNNLSTIFPGYDVLHCHSIKLNRDAELYIEDEYSGNLVSKIQEQLESRNIGVPARFLYDQRIPKENLDFLCLELGINQADVVPGGRYHNFNDLTKLPNPLAPKLKEPKLPDLPHCELDKYESMFDAISQRDYILHFPYNPYDYVLVFFNEAAIDPDVTEIKLTVYRVAANSAIANALISAVQNGKKVTVFVELKARFDEANNLKWAAAMKKEGIKIIYSIPGLKVHAKVALIIRKKKGKRQEFAFFGTGNFNEGTAKIYSDHGLFTANRALTDELNQVFKYLNKRKKIPVLNHLLVSQFNILPRFMELMEGEIDLARQGKKAVITVKLNNLEDGVMIDKLYEASRAGVQVNLIVRGICCLIPGLEGMSENIRVVRIVDRFLEHARIFIFHNEGDPKVYLGSADWMKRNLYHRVEVVFPILDEEIKAEILEMIHLQLIDNVKASDLDSEHNNVRVVHSEGTPKHRSQEETYYFIEERMKALEERVYGKE